MPQERLGRAGTAGDDALLGAHRTVSAQRAMQHDSTLDRGPEVGWDERPPSGMPAGPFLPWLAAAAFALVLAGASLIARTQVTLRIDGHDTLRSTRAGTVADVLAEAGVASSAGDLVQPAPGERLGRGELVVVARARAIRIRADGRTVLVHSHGRSVLSILRDAALEVGAGDEVRLNGRTWPLDRPVPAAGRRVAGRMAMPDTPAPAAGLGGALDPWTVDIYRAARVKVVEEGLVTEREIAGRSVGEALVASGIPVWPQDVLQPAADEPVAGGMRIEIHRATPFVVATDGAQHAVRSWADTVGDGLERAGLGLVGRDYAIPPADTPLTPGLLVQIVRVVEDVLVREVAIPYGTVTQADPDRELDQTEVLRPGQPGAKTQTIRISYENGVEVDRQLEEETIIRQPVDEILAYGTRVTWQTVDTPEGPKRYWRHLVVYATSYSASRAGTPITAPWYGRTRMGLPARKGIIAVDPHIIPLGTWMFVPGYGIAVAGDTGGGIRRYHIDLCFDDDAYESWHRNVEVYLLEPLPPEDDMPWILP